MRLITTFAFGVLFGIGLYVSGMTDPRKVQGFLDVFGLWDPSLAFVMGGAISVGLLAFQLASRRQTPDVVCGADDSQAIDRDLIVGATVFGVGWGLSGVCPGPAIFNLASLDMGFSVFFVAMAAGMAIERAIPARAGKRAAGDAANEACG